MSHVGCSRRRGGQLVRILLISPDTPSENIASCGTTWGRVVDLGMAGQTAYHQWSQLLQCEVEKLPKLDVEDFRRVRESLFSGFDRVRDAYGLDWWELLSIDFHQRLERILKLQKLAGQIEPGTEIGVTQTCPDTVVLQRLLRTRIQILAKSNATWERIRHYTDVASKFSLRDLLQIFGDKFDAGYRLRRHTAGRRKPLQGPVVLLPSAYVNASRMLMRYARTLPEENFLLVTTRPSGWIADPPSNVAVAKLASYVRRGKPRQEFEILRRQLYELQQELRDREEFAVLADLGLLNALPRMLLVGLEIRNAWLNLLADEPIKGVLCGDDANSRTLMPLLLAAGRGLPILSCHHGALDGRYRFRRVHPGILLAKSRMEKNYLVTSCGVAREKVELTPPHSDSFPSAPTLARPSSIVFFSEPYEILGGRCKEFYRDVLPPLADIASQHDLELVVKLHPMESIRERRGFVEAALSPAQSQRTRVVDRPLSDELFAQIWFAVTVVSTTALDCALRQVPCFLCQWLDNSNYQYQEQFLKSGVGMALASPAEIPGIPRSLKNHFRGSGREFWGPASTVGLQQLLRKRETMAAAV